MKAGLVGLTIGRLGGWLCRLCVDEVWELVGGRLSGLEDERWERGHGERGEVTNLLRVGGSWWPFCMIVRVESLCWLGQWRRRSGGGMSTGGHNDNPATSIIRIPNSELRITNCELRIANCVIVAYYHLAMLNYLFELV